MIGDNADSVPTGAEQLCYPICNPLYLVLNLGCQTHTQLVAQLIKPSDLGPPASIRITRHLYLLAVHHHQSSPPHLVPQFLGRDRLAAFGEDGREI